MAGDKKTQRKRKNASTGHLLPQELYRYFQRALSENRECEIESHLATCRRCARLARQVQALLALIDDWTRKTRLKARMPVPRKQTRK